MNFKNAPYTTWKYILKQLKKRITQHSYNAWIDPIELSKIVNQTVYLNVPDEVFVYWLTTYYTQVIADELSKLLGYSPEICFVSEKKA